ncbi:MAG: hypothetical protein J6W13_11245 [Salinivirgaceae bacterium]|nr:hypothetical protein [Salinivirgaceae bacterium]
MKAAVISVRIRLKAPIQSLKCQNVSHFSVTDNYLFFSRIRNCPTNCVTQCQAAGGRLARKNGSFGFGTDYDKCRIGFRAEFLKTFIN